MKARYQSFLFIALLFLTKKGFPQSNELKSELAHGEEQRSAQEQDPSSTKNSIQLQYDDMPYLPIDEISEGQSATAHEPIKKLRFRSFSKDDLELEQETRVRQR
jgi:hypothetical protein